MTVGLVTRVASLPLTVNCDETRQRCGDELHVRRGKAVAEIEIQLLSKVKI